MSADLNAPGWVNIAGEWRWTGAGDATAREPEGHDWHKSEPATDGATPVWACKRCGLYRTTEPARYDLNKCLRDF